MKYTPQQRIIMKQKMEKKLKEAYPALDTESGIYMFYRITAYIGKSSEKNGILGRCAYHCISHQQHIDNSIHSRKLSCDGGQWFIKPLIYCKPSEVDKYERFFIDKYKGNYELLNIESGGTDGKTDIAQRKEPRGYRDGIAQGEKKAREYVRTMFEKYLDFEIKGKANKVKERKLQEFKNFLQNEENT